VFPDLANHQGLAGHGLAATVNSDDPAYFGGYMNSSPAAGMTADHAYQPRNSFEAGLSWLGVRLVRSVLLLLPESQT
jgi:adenosine deaminase